MSDAPETAPVEVTQADPLSVVCRKCFQPAGKVCCGVRRAHRCRYLDAQAVHHGTAEDYNEWRERAARLTPRQDGAAEPWPGCYADLQRRRVTTLAKLGLMLSIMAGGEAGEVVGFDAADLYGEVLMALAIEDSDNPDIALEVARDHPEGDMLVAAPGAPPVDRGRP